MSSRKYCTDINTLAWGCKSSCRGEGEGVNEGGPGPSQTQNRPHGWSLRPGVLASGRPPVCPEWAGPHPGPAPPSSWVLLHLGK